jgi:hypothetical protein
MKRAWFVVLVAVAVFAGYPASAQAQEPRPSQRGTVSQTINTTVVTVTYDRPVARGRQLFGPSGLMDWGARWTPGANRATILEFSRDVTIAGNNVPAGKYSVWTILGETEWTLILNRGWDSHHAIYPGDDKEALRMTVRPERGAHMETLAWYFPVVGPYEATLRMHWGEVMLPIRIEVGR